MDTTRRNCVDSYLFPFSISDIQDLDGEIVVNDTGGNCIMRVEYDCEDPENARNHEGGEIR